MALQLDAGTTLAANSYSCTFSSSTGQLTTSNITPSPTDFSIWPADYLKRGLWNPLNLGSIPAYIEGDDCYDIIGFASPYKITGNSTNEELSNSVIQFDEPNSILCAKMAVQVNGNAIHYKQQTHGWRVV